MHFGLTTFYVLTISFSFSSTSSACNWVFHTILETTFHLLFEQGGLENEPINTQNTLPIFFFLIPCLKRVVNIYKFCILEVNFHCLREATLVPSIIIYISHPCCHPHYNCTLPLSQLAQLWIMNLYDCLI